MTVLPILIGIAVFGFCLLLFLDIVARNWFDFRTRWGTFHASEDWKNRTRARAFRRDGKRCCFCDYDKRLQGHFRDYSRMGRAVAWNDVTTLCATCHTPMPRSQALRELHEREKDIPPLPVPSLPQFPPRVVRKAFRRDGYRCRGCATRFLLGLHSRTGKADWRDCYTFCSTCLGKLKAIKRQPYSERSRSLFVRVLRFFFHA